MSLWKQDLSGGWVQLDDLSQDGEDGITSNAKGEGMELKAAL